jgi:hypothetical protein
VSGTGPRKLRLPLTTVTLLAALAVFSPAPALADFHLVSIREVFPGSAAQPDAEYAEFQAYTSGQNFVSGHSVTFYDSRGALIRTEGFTTDVPDGRNQMTFVMATPAAESQFGIVADEGMTGNLLDPTGGAICWASLDCVSWGSFSGSLPSPAGTPAAAIPDGMALRRTISPGCPTLLEATDDHDNSASDFDVVFPNPRPNSVVPTEHACDSSGVPGGGGNEPGAPQTKLRGKPRKVGHDRTSTFRFGSSEAGSTFQCKVDRKPFRSCRSPFTTRRLSFGEHIFRVRARDAGGKADPSPATFRFEVVRRG